MSIVLGTPTHATPSDMQLVCDSERVLAADRDQHVDAFARQRVEHRRDVTLALVRVRPRSAQDRAAAVQQPSRRADGQLDHLALDDTSPPVPEAHDLVPEDLFTLAHDGASHGVEPGAVTPAVEQTDAHRAP